MAEAVKQAANAATGAAKTGVRTAWNMATSRLGLTAIFGILVASTIVAAPVAGAAMTATTAAGGTGTAAALTGAKAIATEGVPVVTGTIWTKGVAAAKGLWGGLMTPSP